MPSVRSLATLLLVLTLAASGCALGVTGLDPDRPRDEVPKCDSGKGLVGLDGVVATLAGIGGIVALADDAGSTGATLLATSALFTASAYRGNRVANECRAAFDEFAQRTTPQVADRPATRPTAVKRKPPPEPARPPVSSIRLPPEAVTDPAASVGDEELEKQPPAPYQAPRPKQTPKPPPKPSDDDWSSFWKERP